jgi:hypothetical protein
MNESTEEKLPCADKLVFETREAASASANVVAYRYGSKVRPYKCQYCSLWHLSSS